MIVATWNIGSLYEDYAHNIQTVQSWIEGSNIDILCLQELPEIEGLHEQIKRWGRFQSYSYSAISPSHICIGYNMGIGIFSSGALKEIDHFVLAKPLTRVFCNGHEEILHDKIFSAVETTCDRSSYLVVCGHGFPFYRYGLEDDSRYFQYVYTPLDGWLSSLSRTHGWNRTVIGADFNSEIVFNYMPNVCSHLQNVFQGDITRPNGRKTDGILVEQHIKIRERKILRSNMDHFMLKAII